MSKTSDKLQFTGEKLTKLFPDPTRIFESERPYHPILLILFLIPVYSFVFGFVVPLKLHWVVITVIMATLMHLVFSYGHVWYIIVLMVTIDLFINSILMPQEILR